MSIGTRFAHSKLEHCNIIVSHLILRHKNCIFPTYIAHWLIVIFTECVWCSLWVTRPCELNIHGFQKSFGVENHLWIIFRIFITLARNINIETEYLWGQKIDSDVAKIVYTFKCLGPRTDRVNNNISHHCNLFGCRGSEGNDKKHVCIPYHGVPGNTILNCRSDFFWIVSPLKSLNSLHTFAQK